MPTPAYILANLVVQDPAQYRTYEKGIFPILKRFNGELVTYDDTPDTLEGDSPRPGRVILLRFPSEEQARAWYTDPGYQKLSGHRRAGTKLEFLTLVRGLPPRA